MPAEEMVTARRMDGQSDTSDMGSFGTGEIYYSDKWFDKFLFVVFWHMFLCSKCPCLGGVCVYVSHTHTSDANSFVLIMCLFLLMTWIHNT